MANAARTTEQVQNPANTRAQSKDDQRAARKRIPMSIPRLKLHVPEGICPGFHLHWFRDEPGRIAQAVQGGYEFVDAVEDGVDILNNSLANTDHDSGNTDLGTRVSIYGGADEKGNAQRLYLMKIRQEWFEEDQESIQAQNDNNERTIRQGRINSGKGGENQADVAARYANATIKTNRSAARAAAPAVSI